MLKKLMALVFGALIVATPAAAADRTDCVRTDFTEQVEIINKNGGKVTPFTDAETATILEKKGPPPNETPYTFTLAEQGDLGVIVVHDKECVLNMIGPVDINAIKTFIGRVEA